MRSRHLCAKWLLILTCLIMVFCLIQRAAILHQSLVSVVQASQGFKTVSASEQQEQQDNDAGPSPCQLSAMLLLGAQPLFFDGAIPALLTLLLLTVLFFELHRERFIDKPVPLPLIRIHLKNCVFRE